MTHLKQCPVCETDFNGRENQIFCSKKCKNKYHNSNREFNVYDEYKSLKFENEKLKSKINDLKLSVANHQQTSPVQEQVQLPVREPDQSLVQELQLQTEIVNELSTALANEKLKSESLQQKFSKTTESNRNMFVEIAELKEKNLNSAEKTEIKRLTDENNTLRDLVKNKMTKISDKQKEIKSDIEHKVKTISQLKQKEVEYNQLNAVVGKLGEVIGKKIFG